MKNEVTQDELKELLSYDPLTGIFRWIKVRSGVRAGEVAGSINGWGYRHISVIGNRYQAHRLAWLYVYGEWPHDQIDHINRDKLDNRINNLRDVNQSVNMRNAQMNKNNTSGVLGVYWVKKRLKWISRINFNGRTHHLGEFNSFPDAVCTRKAAEKEHGYHPNHGRAP